MSPTWPLQQQVYQQVVTVPVSKKTKTERVLPTIYARYKKDTKDGIHKIVFDNRTFYAYRHMYRKIFRLIFR